MRILILVLINGLIVFFIGRIAIWVAIKIKYLWKERHSFNLSSKIKKKKADITKYMVMYNNAPKIGDMVKSDSPAYNMQDVMIVLDDNIIGPDTIDGKMQNGYLVLLDNKKYFIARSDCYKIKETN